jgi:glutamate-1-semialdehyde 2,1-aminomutase
LQLTKGIQERAKADKIPLTTVSAGGLFGIFFTHEPEIHYYEQVIACQVEKFPEFFNSLLDNGIYIAPSAFEAGFMSLAHTPQDIQQTLSAVSAAWE